VSGCAERNFHLAFSRQPLHLNLKQHLYSMLTCQPLILASASPRRQQFLRELGLQFTILPADIDETRLAGE